jgi:PAS domain S-box-containing protein
VKLGDAVTAPAPVVKASAAANKAGTRDVWTRLAWPFLLAGAFLILVSGSSIYLVISSQSSREMANRALQLENKLWGITAIVRVAESEQRGYLLTGNADYLEVYHNTIDASVAAMAELERAVVEDPVQRGAVADIEPLMLRKFAELQETIRLYNDGQQAAALSLVRTGVGRDLMAKIRSVTLRLMTEQRQLVSNRSSNSLSTNLWLLLVNLAGLALIIVVAIISVVATRRSSGRELARSESRGDELQATMEQRRKTEQKFREMLEAAPDAMVVVNQSGEIMLLNLQAEKQFGYRRDELVGQKVTNIIPDGFAERLLADGLRSPADALAQQIGTGIELVGRRKDGGEFPIEIMLSPLEDSEGILVTAAIRDISMRKEAEKHLAQMEARYRGLLEAAPDAMVVVNKNAEIVLVNRQAKLEFGYRRAELLGQKVTQIIPEGFAERLLEDGVDATAQQILKGIDFTGRRKKGDKFPIEIMLSPLESGEGILVIRDISLRKDEERRVARMESRYRGLLQAAPDAMVVVNHGGEILLANLQAEKEFGYGKDELLGQNMRNIVPERIAEQTIANGLHASLVLQIGTEIELIGRRKDGGEFPVEIMLSPLESAERILVIRDISARRKTERLKDEFVATVSHELRTPLTSISGSLGLLAGQWASKMPESAARLLTIAHTNSQRLARLLNDILDIEKLESGHVVFNLSKVAVHSLAYHTIEDNRGFAESYGVRVRLGPASVDLDVNADPDRLAQVITNLLSNAIKFSPPDGEVLVEVEQNTDFVRITVRDHGSGVPDEFKPHIFEKFAQADAANTRQKGGTGLGLSIVKQIVERLRGKIGFDNAPGGGAVFYVDLPVWDGRAGGEIDLDSPGARILFCEDDRAVAAVVRNRLQAAGFAVDFAHTVADALARATATRYAAILVDRALPDGDGVGLIVQLRAQVPNRDLPIIMVSGDPEQGRSDVRSSRLNVLHWLAKPIAFAPLISILKKATAVPPRQRPRILHVDDDYNVLGLVNHELSSIADVISADCVESALQTVASERIDLVVLDIMLGQDSGLDLLPDLRDGSGNVIPVIIFSNHSAEVEHDDQVGFALSKMNSSLESLAEAVRDRLAIVPAQFVREVA